MSDDTIDRIHEIEDVEELRGLASTYLIMFRDLRALIVGRLDAIEKRMAAVERRASDVDARTRGMVRLR